jgi:hypothetical protein
MTGSDITNRVFVVGVPRSGTTLVQSLLAAHSTLTSFTESHFFDRNFSRLPLGLGPILTRNPGPDLVRFLTENGVEDADLARSALGRRSSFRLPPMLPFYTRRAAREFLELLDELAIARGAAGWIEKTPRHLFYIPLVEKLGIEPGPRFVHVIRDGLEVVASLHEASQEWERPYDLGTCVRRWNADVRFSLMRIAESTDHLVFYEELTSKPEPTLRRLLDELGLGWEPDILDRYGRAAEGLITDAEAWKADVGRAIRPSATSTRVLTPEQRRRVSGSLRRDLYDRLVAHQRP